MSNNDTVISALKQQTLDQLKPRLSLVIEETADYLFSLSTSTRQSANQNHCYDALSCFDRNKTGSATNLRGCCRIDSFEDHQEDTVNDPALQEAAELTLLDLEVFEETLAIEKIVRASTERFWVDLESLMFRLGSALNIPAENIKLPVSPYLICSAYRQALRDIEFPRNFLVDADSAFARKLLPELADIYQCLNSHLRNIGLLPDIEEELTQTGSQILINHGNRKNDTPRSTDLTATLETDAGLKVTAQPVDSQRLIHETDWINSLSMDIAASNIDMRPYAHQSVDEMPIPPDQLRAAGGRKTFVPPKIVPPSRNDAARNRLLSSTEHLLERRPPPSLEMESECLRIARSLLKVRSEENKVRLDYEQLLALIGFDPQISVSERLRDAQKISAQLFDYC